MDERGLQQLQHVVSDEELRKQRGIPTTRTAFPSAATTSESDGNFYSTSSEDDGDGASSLDSGSEEDFESGGSVSCSTDSISSDESICGKIRFLHEKQKLLKRASDHFASEQTYNAFNALRDLEQYSMTSKQDSHGIVWHQAQTFMEQEHLLQPQLIGKTTSSRGGAVTSSMTNSEEYSSGGDGADSQEDAPRKNKRKNASLSSVSTLAPSCGKVGTITTGSGMMMQFLKSNPCPRAKEIDTSRVKLMTSKMFEQEQGTAWHMKLSAVNAIPELISSNQWMTQALIMSTGVASTHHAPGSNSGTPWKTIVDPETSTLGLVPPSHASLRHSVTLQEAMDITDQPQLVAQSTPPFTVVSANKAFLQFAGLESAHKIVGEPIESILQQSGGMSLSSTATSITSGDPPSMSSVLFWIKTRGADGDVTINNKLKLCNLQVKPVVNESKRRRLSNDHSSSSRNTQTSYLSHLLVVLRETTQQAPVVMGTVG